MIQLAPLGERYPVAPGQDTIKVGPHEDAICLRCGHWEASPDRLLGLAERGCECCEQRAGVS